MNSKESIDMEGFILGLYLRQYGIGSEVYGKQQTCR